MLAIHSASRKRFRWVAAEIRLVAFKSRLSPLYHFIRTQKYIENSIEIVLFTNHNLARMVMCLTSGIGGG